MTQYSITDQHLHWLCQTIAKANRSFVPKQEDDSHTNLYFDALGNRITGRWIDTPNGKLILTLNLANLKFEWLNDSLQLKKSFISIGKTAELIEKEIEAYLKEINMDPAGFWDELHFEIPDYSFKSSPISRIDTEHIIEWMHFRQLANDACTWALGYLQQEGEVRIWPHHFDTGIYVAPNEKIGIGFGLAMEDDMAGAPYFYLSGYPLQGKIDYSDVPLLKHGRWKTGDHWNGAVLPITEINSQDEQEVISDFLRTNLNWLLQ